ncbi:response regulator [Roseomonas sp. OT10]|uniref:ATP-binding protein n=1 Tax=Roseomonas cutis TaxID=2897332 RepID=UPI001E4FC8D6|nr:ATP-binding protein [Roseomonas sp. OT10]UFN48611.1 response regulator [Roseomonas sp. OT10]
MVPWSTWRLGGRQEPAEAGFSTLFEAIREPAALLDPAGQVAATNPALRELLGPAVPVTPPFPPERLFAPPERPGALAWLAGGGVTPFEASLSGPDGSEAPLVAPRLRQLPEGARLLLLEDLSERRRFRQRAEEGERLRAVGQLAGGIAHDFNNLLSVIVSAAEAARQQAPALRGELDPLLEAADRGAGLVRRLLALAGRQYLEPRVVVLDEAVMALEPLLRPLLGRGIRLELRPGAPGRRALVDPVQLDQVVLNLATNARQAMPAGGRLTIATEALVALREEPGVPDTLPPGRWSVLSVTDTGPGIPPEVLPRVFEPFFTTRGAEGGTGLGLATVLGIVRQSQGVLQVASRPGEGTSFRIHLPRHEGPVPAVAMPPPPAPAPVAEDRSLPVLLVDDEVPLRRLVERALTRAGMLVHGAGDAEEALALLEDGLVPAVMVTDVAMPGLDGTGLAREARRRLPGLRVILVSGYAEAALDGGVEPGTEFLSKPYRPQDLIALIRRGAAMPGPGNG